MGWTSKSSGRSGCRIHAALAQHIHADGNGRECLLPRAFTEKHPGRTGGLDGNRRRWDRGPVLGIVLFSELTAIPRIASITLIVAGIDGLKLSAD